MVKSYWLMSLCITLIKRRIPTVGFTNKIQEVWCSVKSKDYSRKLTTVMTTSANYLSCSYFLFSFVQWRSWFIRWMYTHYFTFIPPWNPGTINDLYSNFFDWIWSKLGTQDAVTRQEILPSLELGMTFAYPCIWFSQTS